MATEQYIASCQERIALLIDLNRPQEAEELAHQLLAQYPRDAHTQRLLGLSLLRQQRTEDALNALQQAVGTDPLHPLGYAWLAEAATDGEDWRAAQHAIREALRLAPEHAPFHGLLAFTYLGLLQPRAALKAARAGLALDPREVQCQNVQGRALAALGHAQAGATLLVSALADDPSSQTTHTNLGLTYLDAHQYGLARQHFALALQQHPGDDVARQGLLQAFKHRFWLYTLLRWLGRGFFRLLEALGVWRLGVGSRAILFRVPFLLAALAIYIIWPSKTNLPNIGSLATALLVGLALLITALRFSFLAVLRFDKHARHLLSPREAANVNLFLIFVAAGGLFAGIYFLPPTLAVAAGLSGVGTLVPLAGNLALPRQAGWRWSWTWVVLIAIVGYHSLPLEYGAELSETTFNLSCLAFLVLLYGVVFEFYQPSK